MAQPETEERLKSYLGYLEIEMTIMGVLSAFCIVTAGLGLRESMAATGGFLASLWAVSGGYLIVGATLLVLAAFNFYQQRAELAWHHGQLCLSIQDEANRVVHHTARDLLASADDWSTWRHYFRGFACMAAAAVEWLVALIVARHQEWSGQHTRVVGVTMSAAVLVTAAAGYALQQHRLSRDGATEGAGRGLRRRRTGYLGSSVKRP